MKSTAATSGKFFGLRALPAGTRLRDPHILIATWFGAGRLKPASGTMGTIAAVPFGYAIMYFSGYLGLFAAALILCWLGIYMADRYGRASGVTDDQAIVVDEVVGLWLAAVPAALDPRLWLLAFVLFRLFDILKPWPASFFDTRSKGGFDVVMDDVVAGIYAFLGVATAAFLLAMQGQY